MFPRQIRLNGPLIYASARPACKSHRRGLEAVSRFIVPRGSVPGRFSGTREVAVKRHSPSLFRLFPPLSLSFPYFPMAEKQGTAFRDINLPTNGYITSGFFHDGQKGMDGERERERFPRLHFVRISLETVPGSQIALVSPTLPVSSRKEKGTRERKLLLLCLLPRTISSSAVLSPDLCRGEIFSPVKRSLRNWPIEYSPRIRLSSLVKMFG